MGNLNTDKLTTILGIARLFVTFAIAKQIIDQDTALFLIGSIEMGLAYYTNKSKV